MKMKTLSKTSHVEPRDHVGLVAWVIGLQLVCEALFATLDGGTFCRVQTFGYVSLDVYLFSRFLVVPGMLSRPVPSISTLQRIAIWTSPFYMAFLSA